MVYGKAHTRELDKLGGLSALMPVLGGLFVAAAMANVGLPGLDSGAGARYAEASTDKACGRARCGLWAIHRRRLNIVPWIQSNEDLVVEWDGVKHDWAAGDMLDNDNVWTPDVAAAVKAAHQLNETLY